MKVWASCRGFAFVLIVRSLSVLISAHDSIVDAMRGGGVVVGVYGSCSEKLHEVMI